MVRTGTTQPAPGDESSALGLSVAPLTAERAEQANVPQGTKGVIVRDVNPDGRAADAGIQPGDVIQQVNREQVRSVQEFQSAVRRNPGKPALLLISRDGRNLFVAVRPNA